MYEAATGRARQAVLIYGDEVETTGRARQGRVPIRFRTRNGFVNQAELGTRSSLEFYSVDVGQGDATFIVTPSRKTILIDGGLNRRALGFLIWKYRLDIPTNHVDIDLMVLSHADGDHLEGLTPIIQHPQIHVKEIVHNGIAVFDSGMDTRLGNRDTSKKFLVTRHDTLADLNGLSHLTSELQDWRRAVAGEGAAYRAVDSTTGTLDVGDPDVKIQVLGPRLEPNRSYRWFGDPAHTINGHSVVLRVEYDEISILLSGDLNIEGAEHLLADPVLAGRMDAHLFKTPHHGSHEFHYPFLEAVRPQISTISSGDVPDHGHPRASFLGALGLASRSTRPLVFSTEIGATFVGDGETAHPDEGTAIDGLDFSTSTGNETARKRFKLLLPGIINVRTDGKRMFAARRVNTGYWWESYGPVEPAARPSVFGPA